MYILFAQVISLRKLMTASKCLKFEFKIGDEKSINKHISLRSIFLIMYLTYINLTARSVVQCLPTFFYMSGADHNMI